MLEFISNPYVRAALIGVVTAAGVDFAAFKKWQSFDEAASYGWGLAAWRWFQGALTGLAMALGFGSVGS